MLTAIIQNVVVTVFDEDAESETEKGCQEEKSMKGKIWKRHKIRGGSGWKGGGEKWK
jgi:hypothetical protein